MQAPYTPAADACPNDDQVAPNPGARYLQAIAKAGTDDAGAVMKAMREAPIHDVLTANREVRADGRVLYDRYLMQVKMPVESKYLHLSVVALPPTRSVRRAWAVARSPGRSGGYLNARGSWRRRQSLGDTEGEHVGGRPSDGRAAGG
jgi:hypothetical protein